MPHLIPVCGGAAPRNGASPTNSTSLYETHLGLVSLTWSRALFGLSLCADLRLANSAGPASASATSSFGKHDFEEEEEEEDEQETRFNLRVRFWLLWKRKGSKRFRFGNRFVEVVWDLRRARFPTTGGPEPVSGFYVALSVDREMLLIAGDLHEDAYKRTKLLRNTDATSLISRRENVVMKDYTYRTVVRFGGKDQEISIQLSPEKGMVAAINGDQVLRIRRLRRKFRGCEKVQTEDGLMIQISWDLHDWLFGPCVELGPREETAHARFVFKFEKPVDADSYEVKELGWGYCGKSNWSWSSISDKGRKKSFSSMTSSMTSTSSVSSSVMEWTTNEEMEMRRGEAFSLLLYLWKRR
ncbi:DUF868 family protein (DUF868) [Rhynchospora pubera]|uniref:DUF868 family protein (DUF868) n=1 Tax=Rhynchospora pubera TaxID=906938 RepID=A0AAV8FGL2_9POAL|nr:DUF868 family protein (DUF868) [Rhynchospora pubera]